MSRQPRYRKKKDLPLAHMAAVFGVIALLVAGALVMTGGDEDPGTQIIPPIETEDVLAPDTTEEVTPYTSKAIDGAPLPKLTDQAPGESDHGDETAGPVEGEAAEADDLLQVVGKFAELNINRPTDPAESNALNKDLVRLSAGRLARDLQENTGSMFAAQVASTGKVLDMIVLDRDPDYAEVLVVTELSVIDIETKQPLDPTYINYIFRADRIQDNGFAVTSWEPQF